MTFRCKISDAVYLKSANIYSITVILEYGVISPPQIAVLESDPNQTIKIRSIAIKRFKDPNKLILEIDRPQIDIELLKGQCIAGKEH